MDKQLKSRWIKALESGRYRQGKDYLKAEGKFCCLGVLRHIVDPKDGRSKNNDGSVLNRAQVNEFGLPPGVMTKLWWMNDGVRGPEKSFKQIAQWIKENL